MNRTYQALIGLGFLANSSCQVVLGFDPASIDCDVQAPEPIDAAYVFPEKGAELSLEETLTLRFAVPSVDARDDNGKNECASTPVSARISFLGEEFDYVHLGLGVYACFAENVQGTTYECSVNIQDLVHDVNIIPGKHTIRFEAWNESNPSAPLVARYDQPIEFK